MGSQDNEKKRDQKDRKTKKKNNRVRFLDEVDIEQTKRQIFLYKVYYAKHWGWGGICCYPIFDPCFWYILKKIQK